MKGWKKRRMVTTREGLRYPRGYSSKVMTYLTPLQRLCPGNIVLLLTTKVMFDGLLKLRHSSFSIFLSISHKWVSLMITQSDLLNSFFLWSV